MLLPLRRLAADRHKLPGKTGLSQSIWEECCANGRTAAHGSHVELDEVLDYNQDPAYLRDALLYQLTIEARKQVDASPLAKREIIRRLGTSATQFYRVIDQTNYRKSIDQLLKLLHVLDCDVDLVVRTKPHSRAA